MALQQKNHQMTPTEYIEFEKKSEFKHEYFDGEIFGMLGAKKNHNFISSNTSSVLWNQLSTKQCRVFSSDMRVKIEEIEKYTYPDIVVACENMKFLEDELDSLINPVVIIEILSDSTEAYDRGMKFTHYRLIESLQEYILISQDHCQIEKYVRNQDDNTWILSAYMDMEQTVKIESIDCELSLSEVYRWVEF